MRCKMSSCLAIDDFRILDDGLDRVPGAVVEPLEETAVPAGMTRDPACLFDDQQNCVVVAVEANLAHFLNVARALALLPQPAARTRPVVRKSRGRGARKRLTVHPRQRQHGAAFFLGDGGHQPVGVPEYGVEPVAHRCLSVSALSAHAQGYALDLREQAWRTITSGGPRLLSARRCDLFRHSRGL